jgi:tetratricopeptide (TPR) repeat protein
MALRPVVGMSLSLELQRQRSSSAFDRHAQLFLQGATPDWIIANSDVPIDLAAGESFRPVLQQAIEQGIRLVVVLGMAGSGKSTLAMRNILQVSENSGCVLYELSGEARSFSGVFSLVQRLHPTRRVLIYLDDLALYGDTLSADLEKISGNQVVVVATARLSEWNDRFQRYLANVANTFELKRFEPSDFEPLTNRLLRYVPAPAFRRATSEERLRRFRRSRSQLLIALREITESKRFDEVIEDEWSKVEQPSRRFLFYLAGIATIARVGIASHLAAGIFRQRFPAESFDGAVSSLSGIVFGDRENRLRVRHEQYAEHIFDIEPLSEFLESVKSILWALARYEAPLITRLTKNDASLFRWLLNNRSLYRRCSRRERSEDGLAIYESFEKAFELDGHFWLQYGLYCRRLGKLDRAMTYLNQSVQAYPQNIYAIHALADLKLQAAADLNCPPSTAQNYINEAIEELLKLDARQSTEHGAVCAFPLASPARFSRSIQEPD